jgi:hypothetical protein
MTDPITTTATAIPTAAGTTPKQRIIALAIAFLNLEVGDFDQILEVTKGDPRYAPGLLQANTLISKLQAAARRGGEEYGWDAMWRMIFREFLDRARMYLEEMEIERAHNTSAGTDETKPS